jgi:hypothetical protein
LFRAAEADEQKVGSNPVDALDDGVIRLLVALEA